jgi:DNA-binding response OmpR family regulator
MASLVPPPRSFSGVRPRGPLVLVVVESTDQRDAYAAELAAAGFMVLEAADGATAIDKTLRFGPHAVVLDLVLAGLDAYKVARRLRADEATADMVIIAMGPGGSERLEPMALAAGCDAYMAKPVLGAALVGEIVRLLAAKRSSADLTRVTKR